MQINSATTSVRLFIFFLSKCKKRVTGFALLSMIMGSIPTIDSVLLKHVTDLIEEMPDIDAASLPAMMLPLIITYGLWWEGTNIAQRLGDFLYLKTMPIIKGKVFDELYNHVQYYHHKFFQENPAGNIAHKITEGARSLEAIFYALSETILRKFSMILFAIYAMYDVHFQIAVIFVIWVVVFVSISACCTNKVNYYSSEYGDSKAQVAGKIVDIITNVSVVRMFNSHATERRYLKKYIMELVEKDQSMQWFTFKLCYVLGASCSLMIFCMLYYLAILRSQLLITIGDCVLVITLCVAVATDMWDLAQEMGDIFEECGIFSQSTSLIQRSAIIPDCKDAIPLNIINGTIEFQKVVFYYENYKVFNNKSVIIPGKSKVGLVGFSGSGKTTFVSLISRLHDIDSGSILIDAQSIQHVTQQSLRDNISIIPQEPILFNRSIIENIRYGRQDASDQEVMEAAKIAHIHEFVITLPSGYNTLCGERGNNLSGGQRQRLSIARAILKNAPILILDEATSNLDSATEFLIRESFQALMHNKTVIVIAHKLFTLLNMDKILVFDKGVIVEEGSHSELLKHGTLYKRLWQSQVV